MSLSKKVIFIFEFGAVFFNGFNNTISYNFNKYPNINEKYVRANKAQFMTKELHKANMKISKLRNNFSYKRAYTSQIILWKNY